MENKDLSLLWVGAFRYYLGGQNIAVHSFCSLLMDEIDAGRVPDNAQFVIKKGLLEAFAADDKDQMRGFDSSILGHKVDRSKWLEVLGALSGG